MVDGQRPWSTGNGYGRGATNVESNRPGVIAYGIACAGAIGMKAKNIDEVVVYRESLEAEDEVSARCPRP
jgi:hypothetical protein